MAFRIPNPATINTPAERVRWQALERFLQDPVFENGVQVGDGSGATRDGAAGTVVPPDTTTVDKDTYGSGGVPDDGEPPATPSGLSATASVRAVLLRWEPNTEPDMANGFGSYTVEWDTDSGFGSPLSLTASVTGVEIGGLTTGGTVWFRVRAVDAGGAVSDWCSAVSAAPVQVDTPDLAFGSVDAGKLADFVVSAQKLDVSKHFLY